MKKEEEEKILLQLDVREINERYIYPFIDLSHIKKLLQFEVREINERYIYPFIDLSHLELLQKISKRRRPWF